MYVHVMCVCVEGFVDGGQAGDGSCTRLWAARRQGNGKQRPTWWPALVPWMLFGPLLPLIFPFPLSPVCLPGGRQAGVMGSCGCGTSAGPGRCTYSTSTTRSSSAGSSGSSGGRKSRPQRSSSSHVHGQRPQASDLRTCINPL